jgi:hypothetical protein
VTSFDPNAFTAAVLTRLGEVSGLTVYDGEVPNTPPVSAEDGRVRPYAVVYPGAGAPVRGSLSGATSEVPWAFQVTAVGGDRSRCLWAVKKVDGVLLDVRLTVTDWSTSRITRDPGPDIRADNDVQPPRFYVPLLYRLTTAPTT